MELFYPIPKPNLVSRFKPVFSQLQKTRNATLLALPFSGRTSHLRFIQSQPELQLELGKPKEDQFFLIETAKCKSLTQIASEVCLSLDPNLSIHPHILSQDEYLVLSLLKITISNISTPLILGISLDQETQQLHSEIERHFSLLLKSCPNLKVLWSIDSYSFRNYIPGHPSTPITETIFYFPSFTPEETNHSLKRIAKTRQKTLSPQLLTKSMNLTGGIAGLFHLFIFQGETYLSLSQAESIIKAISTELTLAPELTLHLATNQLRQFTISSTQKSFSIGPLKLRDLPSAQEISLLKEFLQKENQALSRDEIAHVLWGPLANHKYSDWAIDKAISRLRQNLASKTHQLITVKGLGYSLICTTN